MQDLFSEVGDLKRYFVHFDRSGRSKVAYQVWHNLCLVTLGILLYLHIHHFQGTAEVVFTRRADAMAAVKKYNDVQLDGKPMKIEIIGRNIVTPAAAPPTTNGVYGNQNGVSRRLENNFLGDLCGEVLIHISFLAALQF